MRMSSNNPKAAKKAVLNTSSNTDSSIEAFKNSSTLSNVWSGVIFVLNIWTLFSTILWVSAKDYPEDVVFFLEVVVENILFSEAIVRLLLKISLPKSYNNLDLYHASQKDHLWVQILVVIGSAPIYTIYSAVKDSGDPSKDIALFSRLLAIKLLRTFEIKRTLSKVEEILFYNRFKALILVKFIKNFMYVFLITHLSTCSWFFIQTTFKGQPMIYGQSASNPFAPGIPYFERNNLLDASLLVKYADACTWAVSTLTGCSFGDVTPRTLEEVLVSIIVFLIGIILLAKIFSDFASLMYLLDIENAQAKNKSLQALKLCRILNIPPEIRYKIQTFYALDNQAFSQTQHFGELKELPKTLYTDVMLCLNRDLISKANIFNFGPPGFVFLMARSQLRYLYPQVSMAGDYIVKVGEYANEMYFIKQGEVEILASDEATRIGILREGAYFGEIGLLITQKRTVTVKALTFCIFEVINKDNFDIVMEAFPKQKAFLLDVARQRIRTSKPEDLDLDHPAHYYLPKAGTADTEYLKEEKEEGIFLLSSKRSTFPAGKISMETSSSCSRLWKKFVEFFKEHSCKSKGLDFRSSFVMLPTSRFCQIWTVLLGLSVFANQIMVPYEISFVNDSDPVPGYWYALDVILVVIHFLDIFVNLNTSVRHKGMYVSNKEYILRNYANNKLAIDLLAFIPFNYVLMLLKMSPSYCQWVKVFRFLKIFRFIDLLRDIRENGERKSRYSQLLILMVFHISLNHFAACIMYMIASSEDRYYRSSPDITLFKKLTLTNTVDMPLIDQSPYTRYIYFIYWACSVSSSGAYGDIAAVTPFEKLFQVSAMLFFRVYFAFCAAEVAAIVSSAYMSYTENLAKETTYERWMQHIKLPDPIIDRVRRFNNYMWKKYRGLNENQILDDLPSSTRQEILEFLLFNMLETVEIFPNDEVGLFSNIVKDFRFLIVTKGEYIFRHGETVEEIFFIIEGEVDILDATGVRKITHLKQNDFFGETAIIDGKTGTRIENARASTDVSLGILHLSSIRNLWKKYPTLKEKMNKIAQRRRESYQGKQNVKLEIGDKILEEAGLDNKTYYQQEPELQKKNTELEFEKLRKELEEVVEEPENDTKHSGIQSNVYNSLRKDFPDSNASSPSLRFDGKLSMKLKTSTDPKLINKGSIQSVSDVSQVSYNTISMSSKKDLDYIVEEIDEEGYSPEKLTNRDKEEGKEKDDSNENDQGNNMNECFIYSNRIEESEEVTDGKCKQFIKSKLLWFERQFRSSRVFLLSLILLFECFYRPLNLSLDLVDYNSPFVTLEVVFMVVYILNLWINVKDYYLQKNVSKIFPSQAAPLAIGQDIVNKNNRNEGYDEEDIINAKAKVSGVELFLDFLFIIPFQMIFFLANLDNKATNVFLIAFQLLRLINLRKLTQVFQLEFFKKRYALGNIIVILVAFVVLNHICACFFIMLAKAREDFNTTWLAKIPAPQTTYPNNTRTTAAFNEIHPFTIYIHALYWSYVTSSHVGVGDVTGVNSDEKIYSTFIILATTFLYAFLFGNLASLVDDLTPQFQKEFEENYLKVLEYAKATKLGIFVDKIHAYYSYIWQNTKGIDENKILDELPNSLKNDIFLARYNEIVSYSNFFKNNKGVFDQKVFYSFCKKYRVGIYMKNDFIITVGQEVNDIFIILEGSAEAISYNFGKKQPAKLGPGDYFGGVFANMTQIDNIMATEITKVAILPQACFFQLKEAFPEWYQHIIKDDKMYKIAQKLLANLRKRIYQRKNNTPSYQALKLENEAAKSPKSKPELKVPITDPEKGFRFMPETLDPEHIESPRSSNDSDSDVSEQPDNLGSDSKRIHPIGLQIPGVVKNEDSSPEKKPEDEFSFSDKPIHGSAKHAKPKFDPRRASVFNLTKIEKSQGFLGFFRKKSKRISMPEVIGASQLGTQPSLKSNVSKDSELIKGNHRRTKGGITPVIGSGAQSTANTENQHRLSNFVRMPSFLIQEEEQNEDDSDDEGNENRRRMSKKKGIMRKVTLRKNTDYMSKNLANKFLHLADLKKKLINQLKELKYYVDPNSEWKTLYELVHTFVIIYSLIAVPVYVCFDLEFGLSLIIIESFICVEQIAYIILLARTAQFAFGILTLDRKIIWPKLWEKGLLIDLIATIPFNLILGLLDVRRPLLVTGIFRMNRVILFRKLSSQLGLFSAKYPQLGKYIAIIKPTFYLAFGSHLIACLFSFSLLLEPKEYFSVNFYDFLEFSEASVARKYIVCLCFILSIATTTGYGELIIYNNYERIIFIVCVYLGDALFALILGWFSSTSSTLPEKYNAIFHKIRKIDSVLQQQPIPKKVRNKVVSYFTYVVDSRSQNKSCLELLSGLLPQTMLKDMAYHQTSLFHNFPLVQEFKQNKVFINEIITHLTHTIYLPQDYIISRNDFGSEVYCIAEGVVHILSPSSEKKVMGVLRAGDYFGELGVYTTTKRLTSFVAATFCVIYILEKEVLKNILKAFPHANFEFKLFGNIKLGPCIKFFLAQSRIDEYTDFNNKGGVRIEDRILQNFSVFRSMSNVFEKNKEEVTHLLKTCEVPRFLLQSQSGTVSTGRNDTSRSMALQSPLKPQLTNPERSDQNNTMISLNSTIWDYVEEDEINYKDLDHRKTSFRVKSKTKERRFSRLKRTKEKSVAKNDGITVTWGINMN